MKQFKKQTPTPNPITTPNDTNQKNKSKIVKQIQKLQQRIQNSNQDIKNTEKMLDIDMFLKQQKQKRLQHAKNINAEYEAAKKMREQKLYKKFKREDREKQSKQDNQSQTNTKTNFNQQKQQQQKSKQKQSPHNLFQTQTLNIPVLNPISIIKSLVNQQSSDKTINNGIKDGHHYKPNDLSQQKQSLRQSQSKILGDLYRVSSNKNKYDGTNDNDNIAWKNIKQVGQNQLQIQSMPGKIQQNSLIPNDTDGENILSALVLMKPQIIKQTFNENDNIFLCELFTPESQVTVYTDKIIQVRQFKHKSVNLGSRSQNSNIMWPTLIQKCFTKLKLVKNMPHLSNSINKTAYTFFGIDPQLLYISNKNVIKQNFHLVLGHLLQQASIGFLNINGYSTKTYENRVYPLQQIRQQIQKQDKNKQQRKVIKYKIINPWRGKLIDSQNINRFTLLQLLQLFNCLVIIRDYPQKYTCLRITTNFFSNGGISLTGTEWTKNPQYLFTIKKQAPLRIIMRKSGQIGAPKSGVYGFLLFQNKQSSNKIQSMKMDWLVIKTKSTDINQCIYDGELNKGNYILIPYCTDQSEKQYQFYVIDFVVEKGEKSIQFGKARIYDYNYVDKKKSRLNAGDAKIIQSLQTIEKFERPKIQKVQIPVQYKPKITQQILQSLNLNLFKNVSLKHFYMPGLISNLLINKSIQIEQPKQNNKNNRLTDGSNNQNTQLSEQQKAQNLQILIGYDAINDDINQGQMKDIMEQSVGCYDFDNYGLEQQGLTAVLEVLSTHAQIVELSLKNNDLNDSAITYLCYSMYKGNRTQLKKLTVSNNKFGNIGKRALQGLKSTFPKMTVNY